MRKQDHVFLKGGNGEGYIKLATGFAQKNHQLGAIATSAGRIQNPAQVLSVQRLISRLHPECDRLFRRPKAQYSPREEYWFTKAPIGKDTSGEIRKTISADAGTSKMHTNHCVRAFTASRRNAENVPERHIMAIAGHRNAQSVTSYCRPAEEQECCTCHLIKYAPPGCTMLHGCTTAMVKLHSLLQQQQNSRRALSSVEMSLTY